MTVLLEPDQIKSERTWRKRPGRMLDCKRVHHTNYVMLETDNSHKDRDDFAYDNLFIDILVWLVIIYVWLLGSIK